MRKSDSPVVWRLGSLLLLAGFVVIAVALLETAFSRSNAYPPYSSLRSDPVGAKALFESLREVPSLSVERNRLRRLTGQPATTYLFLGIHPGALRNATKTKLEQWEGIARAGGRVVLGATPVEPLTAPRTGPFAASLPAQYEVEKRWGIRTRWMVDRQERFPAKMPRRSAFSLEIPEMSAWTCRASSAAGDCEAVERSFGRGSLVLLTQTFSLSNEGLQKPDGNLVAWVVGRSARVVFDEEHLGLVETGSVGALIRRYRLAGAMLVLALLGVLFVWRQAGHFLPERPVSARAAARSLHASTGLVNLLRRHITRNRLIAACLQEWRRSLSVLPFGQRQRADRVGNVLAAGGDVVAQYRSIVRSLHE